MIDQGASIVIQARLSSTRLPKKIFKKINDKSLLEYMLDQLKNIKKNFPIIIATTTNSQDDKLVNFLKDNSITYYRGAEYDLVKRYCDVVKKFNIKNIIRLTSDCPLIDPHTILKLYNIFKKNNLDYISTDETYPDGMDVEIVKSNILNKISNFDLLPYQREHPTQYIIENKKDFKFQRISYFNNYGDFRLTVDQIEDFKVIKKIILYLKNKNKKPPYKLNDIIEIVQKNNITKINNHIKRNEGLEASKKISM